VSSLTLSILIHAGLGVLALFIVFSTGVMDKQVDFLPGGGTAQGRRPARTLQHKVQQKKRSSINKTMPMKKLVSTSMNSAITLPEAPPDALDMPDVSAMLGGGALGRAVALARAEQAAVLAKGWAWAERRLCDAAAVDAQPLLDAGAVGEAAAERRDAGV
jgi:hypothetical protein